MEKSDLPIIIESETSNLFKALSGNPHNGSRLARKFPKIIFLIVGIIILGEIIYGIRTLYFPSHSIGKIQPISQGKLILAANYQNYKIGQSVPVTVRVDSGGHTINGVDLVLKYDPKVLDLTPDQISTGNIFLEYPLASVDNTNGLVRVSGIASIEQQGFNGIGRFATLNFLAKSTSSTSLIVQFKPGITTDSNLVEINSSQNILGSANRLNLNITK